MSNYIQPAPFDIDYNFSYGGYISKEALEKAWSVSDRFGLDDDEEFILAVLVQKYSEGQSVTLTEPMFAKHPIKSLCKTLAAAGEVCETTVIVSDDLTEGNVQSNFVKRQDALNEEGIRFGLNAEPREHHVYSIINISTIKGADY